MSFTVKRWCNQHTGLVDWPIPTKCQPCACLWSNISGFTIYDPNGICAKKPAWGLVGEQTGSGTPGSAVSVKFRMGLDGEQIYVAGGTFANPSPPPTLSAPPLFPGPLEITMAVGSSGAPSPVFTFDPAAGSVENFVDRGYVGGLCTFYSAPEAAFGWPCWRRLWQCEVTFTLSGIQLATPDNPYPDGSYDQFGTNPDPDQYRGVAPYTGPLPEGEAVQLFLGHTPDVPYTLYRDSGIPIYNCSNNSPVGSTFSHSSTCGGILAYPFFPVQKYQFFP